MLREHHRCTGLVSLPKTGLASLRVDAEAPAAAAGGHHMLSEKGQTTPRALLWHWLRNANPVS